MPPVAISSAPIPRRKKRDTAKAHQGTPDVELCRCPRCVRTGKTWPSYYVGLWIYLPKRSAPPEDWVVKWLSFDCFLDGRAPHLDEQLALLPATDGEALDCGLSVRDGDRRSIWAPLMEGACEACGDLRVTRRRFCRSCEAKMVIECRRVAWEEERIKLFLAAPVNGRDPFVGEWGVDEGAE